MTKRPSISMPDAMVDEIKERREKGTSRSEYVRKALRDRFRQEDAGTWDPADGDADHVEQPADD